jgi:hypothetical protein
MVNNSNAETVLCQAMITRTVFASLRTLNTYARRLRYLD